MCTISGPTTSRYFQLQHQSKSKSGVIKKVARAGCSEYSQAKFKCRTVSFKSVRFHHLIQVHRFQRVREKHAHQSCWYDKKDYAIIRRENNESLQAVKENLSGNPTAYDSNRHCFRGLESVISSRICKQRLGEKSNLVKGVLELQKQQRASGVDSPDILATVSRNLSK